MYPGFSRKQYFGELLRPWKIISFLLALSYYIWGAYYYRCPTWDVPDSLIMSILTYVFAPGTVKEIIYLISKKPRFWSIKFLFCLVIIYACASGSYELYNWWHLGYWPPPTYLPNLFYSIPVFVGAGIVWKHDASFKELMNGLLLDFRRLIARAR